jgi:hypothetical protein
MKLRRKAKSMRDSDLLAAQARLAERLKAEAKRLRPEATSKKCPKCCIQKPMQAFARAPDRVDGRRGFCKDCANTRNREIRKEKPEADYLYSKKRTDKAREDPVFRIHKSISCRIWFMLKGNKSNRRTADIVGYETEELRRHLEKQFEEGMRWDNYGAWQVDHIIPVSAFKSSNEEDIKAAWALSNLRPLWREDNIRKKDRILFLL